MTAGGYVGRTRIRLRILPANAEILCQILSYQPIEVAAVHDTTSPWLVWREQLVTRFRSMHTVEQSAFDALHEGRCFNEVCEVLATIMSEDGVSLHMASLLKAWITQGLISKVE